MASLEFWEKKSGIKILPQTHLENDLVVGRKYHCAWALSRGMVWRLITINGDMVTLRTPKTRKEIKVKKSDLRELNDQVIINAKQRVYINYDQA